MKLEIGTLLEDYCVVVSGFLFVLYLISPFSWRVWFHKPKGLQKTFAKNRTHSLPDFTSPSSFKFLFLACILLSDHRGEPLSRSLGKNESAQGNSEADVMGIWCPQFCVSLPHIHTNAVIQIEALSCPFFWHGFSPSSFP